MYEPDEVANTDTLWAPPESISHRLHPFEDLRSLGSQAPAWQTPEACHVVRGDYAYEKRFQGSIEGVRRFGGVPDTWGGKGR